MSDPAQDKMKEYYSQLNTLPKLVGDFAMSIAEGQRRLDQDYLENLAAFSKIISDVVNQQPDAETKFKDLFKAVGPSRYQFTETVVELRADLQMSSMTEISAGLQIGITVPFAVSVNASYTSRNAYDFQAAARHLRRSANPFQISQFPAFLGFIAGEAEVRSENRARDPAA